jgi:sugar phosphate isomerase/epimerase
MIYVSTGGIGIKTAAQTALNFYDEGIPAVELSGGSYSMTYESDLLALPKDLALQVHNYYPPPEIPFVFNLASSDSTLTDRSVQHVRNAIRLSVLLNRPVYSFHAGFRINPRVAELGQTLGKHVLRDRASALDQFGEKVLLLAEEARREGVNLLVENNVLNTSNKLRFVEDPLLLTHPDEIANFMRSMPSNVGLLLDVAHLKVSARSLEFDPITAHDQVKPWIRGYHLSDNDGSADTNEPVKSDSWFWDVITPGLDYYSLEVYRVSSAELANQYKLVKSILTEKTKQVNHD